MGFLGKSDTLPPPTVDYITLELALRCYEKQWAVRLYTDQCIIENFTKVYSPTLLALQGVGVSNFQKKHNVMFCPGFQKGRVPSEKGTLAR